MSLYKEMRKRAALRKLGFIGLVGKAGSALAPAIGKTLLGVGKAGASVAAGAGKAAWELGAPALGAGLMLGMSSGTKGVGLNKRFKFKR